MDAARARAAPEKAGHHDFATLGELLDALEDAASANGSLSVHQVRDLIGPRAFGPFLLILGLIAVTPLSGIPTVPSIIGIVVTLVTGQIVLGRRSFWLPERLERAALDCGRLLKAIAFLRPIARVVDTFVRRRFDAATGRIAIRLAALACLLVAITMPPLEILPFTATAAGAVIALFGLAITVHDGVLMIVAFVLPALVGAVGYVVFG